MLMTRIALFGTSADPPHRGQAAVIDWLATEFDHVAVWTSNNPFKEHQTPLHNRFHMLELMIEELNAPPDVVQIHPELSHMRTMICIERAQQKWPEAELFLVIGSDLVRQIPSWYRAEDIFASVNLLVVPRPGYDISEAALQYLRQRTRVEVAHMPDSVDVSSSHYRHEEDDMDLTPAIQAYISENQLYSCPEDSKKTLTTP
jgi:nicotinate-nucleotide adenylyltransferase